MREIDDMRLQQEVDGVRGFIEPAIQRYFGRSGMHSPHILGRYIGQLSTDPVKVGPDISSSSLHKMCGPFSEELFFALNQAGITKRLQARMADGLHHTFVKAMDNRVLIDPTLGQFVQDFRHIFVGSREQLYDLVKAAIAGERGLAITDTVRRMIGDGVFSSAIEFLDLNWAHELFD